MPTNTRSASLALWTAIAVNALLLTASAQTSISGQFSATGSLGTRLLDPTDAAPNFFAALPLVWVNSGLTTDTGFCTSTFDATKTMPGDYAATFAGLAQAKTDQAAANQNWLLQIDAGTNIHGSTYDSNNSLLSWPITTYVPGKCLTLRSSTHNTDAATVCSTVYPTIRDDDCSSDAAKFWKFTIDSTPQNGNTGMFFPYGSNNIIVEDMEIAPAAGSAQSESGVKVSIQIEDNGNHNGLAYNWIHGWNPGDAGQPAGACPVWARSSVGNVSSVIINFTTHTFVDWVSGDRFGMDFSDGVNSPGYPQSTVTINGTPVLITGHDPVASDTRFEIPGGLSGSATLTMTNPPTAYANGCGDDSRGVLLNGTDYFFEYNKINRIHWWNGESHAISSGFSAGPGKVAHNWVECGSACFFSGGGSINIRGGPPSDIEIRGNAFLRDLNWRFLTGGAGKSPDPPFGCGPLDGVASHSTCPFNWGVKNNIECKFCTRALIDGNLIDGVWADGQSGYLMLMTTRSDTSGYDPDTGRPYPSIDNVRISNNWFRNAPQVIQISSRSLGSGNGVGISRPIRNMDFINNLVSNVKDTNQFGNPGTDLAQWAASGQTYLATVSRTANVAHAVALPIRVASYDTGSANAGVYRNAFDVTGVTSASDVVTMKLSDQWEPTVGGTVVITGVPGWNGTFTITGVKNGSSTTACSTDVHGVTVATSRAVQPQPCIRADGTFGDTIIYTDSTNHPGTATLCTSTSTCTATGILVTADTLDFKLTDISVGDGVYIHNCTDSSLNAGASSFVPALAPTNPVGLDVYYASTGANVSGISCQIENSAGLPANVTFQSNTDLAVGINSIGGNGIPGQHFNNRFLHNLFAMPAGNNAVLTDSDIGGQGTAVFATFDAQTFQFFDNVIVDPAGTRAEQWSVVPPAAAPNLFPTGVSGYLTGVTFPFSSCTYDGSDPTNCPLMAAPWSTNFSLSNIVPAAEGANPSLLIDALTRTIYVCPSGANCGTTGPYPD